MQIVRVKSLPINEVLANIQEQLGGKLSQDCEVYSYQLPSTVGTGTIYGVNFTHGVAWLQYDCKFKKDIEIHFTVNQIHPLKILYNMNEDIEHTFEGQQVHHLARQFENLIVCSKNTNGHVLKFKKGQQVRLNSIEIDRTTFSDHLACDIKHLDSDLRAAMMDSDANEEHFIQGSCSLKIATIFQTIDSFNYENLVRKMFLASKTFEIIALQLLEITDSNEHSKKTNKKDFQLLQSIEHLLEEDFRKYGSVRLLSEQLNVSESKIQRVFKDHYGETGNEHIKNVRMKLIVDMLDNSEMTIGDIAKLVGIDSSSYLSKIFKETYGLSPIDYKRAK